MYNLVCVFVLTLCTMLVPEIALPQMSGHPVPPGHVAANQATRNSENVEAPVPLRQNVSAAKVIEQADELLSLAQTVHADTQQATQGLLAKDLKDRLRRIEKLSRQLRDELVP